VSVIDRILFIGCDALVVAFVALSVYKGRFRRYLWLGLYTCAILAGNEVRRFFLAEYGVKSSKYFYAYYGSDFFIVVLKCVAVISVFEIILTDSPFRTVARSAFLIFFGLVAAISYALISHSVAHFYSRLIIDFQQNMYFVSVLLTVLLCVTLAHLRVADPQLRILVYGLGASAALQTCNWALQRLLPEVVARASWGVLQYIIPTATVAMLSLWCYALIRIPSMAEAIEQSEEPRRIPVRSEGAADVRNVIFGSTLAKAGARS